jgi:hypothetical protein
MFNSAGCMVLVGFLLGLLFSPEDGDTMFLETLVNICWTTQHYIPEDILFLVTTVRTSGPLFLFFLHVCFVFNRQSGIP